MHADICTGKYVQGVCGEAGGGGASTTGGNLRVVRKRGKEKLRRIKRSPDGTKCGFIRSFDLSLITLLFTFKHTLMSGLKQKLFIL